MKQVQAFACILRSADVSKQDRQAGRSAPAVRSLSQSVIVSAANDLLYGRSEQDSLS